MTTLINVLIWLAIGAVAGWLASLIMGGGLSLLWCIVLGIVGSVVGGFVAGLFGISASTVSIGGILIAVAGACIVLLIARLIRKA